MDNHDARAALINLRQYVERSGSYDQCVAEYIQQLGEALGVCEDSETEAMVRHIVSLCIWNPPVDYGEARRRENDAVEQLMRLIRHREGR